MPATLTHAPFVHESPYESMIFNVYWLFVVAVKQYSSVRCSLLANGALVFNSVAPFRILYDSSVPHDMHFFVTDTYTSPLLHVSVLITTDTKSHTHSTHILSNASSANTLILLLT